MARDSADLMKAACAKRLFRFEATPTRKVESEFRVALFQDADADRLAARAGCARCGARRNAERCFRSHSSARLASTIPAAGQAVRENRRRRNRRGRRAVSL